MAMKINHIDICISQVTIFNMSYLYVQYSKVVYYLTV